MFSNLRGRILSFQGKASATRPDDQLQRGAGEANRPTS